MQLDNKTALVTGAGKRIGREIALALARAGCDVAIHCLGAREEAEVLSERIRRLGRRTMVICADLEAPDAFEPLVQRVVEGLGGIDVLVNNAAVFKPTEWGGSGPDEWMEHFRINALAPVMLAQACQAHLRRSGEGCVVNLTDIYADRPLASHAAYSASKAALASATKSLARLMAPEVRVNAVAPGVGEFPDSYGPAERAAVLDRVPAGRAGTAQEVAAAVLFLVRDASYMTGQTLPVDGGRSAAG
jgi:pteridine reductase